MKKKFSRIKQEFFISEGLKGCFKCGELLELWYFQKQTRDAIRGLLCDLCNKGLGCFKDNVINLETAIKYLKHFSQE